MRGKYSAYAVISGHTTHFSSICLDFFCILLEFPRFQSSKNRKNRVLAVKKNRKMVERLVFSGNVRSRLNLPKKSTKWKLDHFWQLYSEYLIDFWRVNITNFDFKNVIFQRCEKIAFWGSENSKNPWKIRFLRKVQKYRRECPQN